MLVVIYVLIELKIIKKFQKRIKNEKNLNIYLGGEKIGIKINGDIILEEEL